MWVYKIEIEVEPSRIDMKERWQGDQDVDFRRRFFDEKIRPCLESLGRDCEQVQHSASGPSTVSRRLHYHIIGEETK